MEETANWFRTGSYANDMERIVCGKCGAVSLLQGKIPPYCQFCGTKMKTELMQSELSGPIYKVIAAAKKECREANCNVCKYRFEVDCLTKMEVDALIAAGVEINSVEEQDYCYECQAYGDDTYTDENGELVNVCKHCQFSKRDV